MYKIKDLTNQNLNKDLIGKFVDFVVKKLQINEPFSVYFVDDKKNGEKELGKTAMYNPETKSVYIYATNRHPKDMMRSCAHELMHHKQNIAGELGEITPDEAERQANEAGYILRQFEEDMKKKFLLEEGVKIRLREQARHRRGGVYDGWSAVYGDYEKCLPSQKKVRVGKTVVTCYPKKLENTTLTPITNIKNFTLQELKHIVEDIKIAKKNKRSSFFYPWQGAITSKLQDILLILPKILKDIEYIKAAPRPTEDYVIRRAKGDVSSLKYAGASTNERKEKKKRPIFLYAKPVIEAARRLYVLDRDKEAPFPKGSTGELFFGDDRFGGYYSVRNRKIILPQNLLNDLKKEIGKENLIKAREIYGVNASPTSAMGFDKAEAYSDLHMTLDVLGVSADPFGVGITADFLNMLLYLGDWYRKRKDGCKCTGFSDDSFDYFDYDLISAGISGLGVFVIGDAAKVSKGPLRAFIKNVKHLKRTGFWKIKESSLAFMDQILQIFRKILDAVKASVDKISAMRSGAGVSYSLRLEQFITRKIRPALKQAEEAYGQLDLQYTTLRKIVDIYNKLKIKRVDPRIIESAIFETKGGRSVFMNFIRGKVSKRLMEILSKKPERFVDYFPSGVDAKQVLKSAQAGGDVAVNIVNQATEAVMKQIFVGGKVSSEFGELIIAQRKLLDEFFSGANPVGRLFLDTLEKKFPDIMAELLTRSGDQIDVILKNPEEFAKVYKKLVEDTLEEFLKRGEFAEAFSKFLDDNKIFGGVLYSTYEKAIPRVLKGGIHKATGVLQRELEFAYDLFKNTFFKTVLGTEGLGGWASRHYLRKIRGQIKSALQLLKRGGRNPAVTLRGFGQIMLSGIKFVYNIGGFLTVGKINTIINLYIRFYRPFCGLTFPNYLSYLVSWSPGYYNTRGKPLLDKIERDIEVGKLGIQKLYDEYDDAEKGVKPTKENKEILQEANIFDSTVKFLSGFASYALTGGRDRRACKSVYSAINKLPPEERSQFEQIRENMKANAIADTGRELRVFATKWVASRGADADDATEKIGAIIDAVDIPKDATEVMDAIATLPASVTAITVVAKELRDSAKVETQNALNKADPKLKKGIKDAKRFAGELANRAKAVGDKLEKEGKSRVDADAVQAEFEKGFAGLDESTQRESLSLNDVLKEYKEKELNDKFNKLVKGMTE